MVLLSPLCVDGAGRIIFGLGVPHMRKGRHTGYGTGILHFGVAERELYFGVSIRSPPFGSIVVSTYSPAHNFHASDDTSSRPPIASDHIY